jgi:WD40 repeat protein
MPDFTKPTLAWNLTWDADWVTAVAFCGGTRRVAAGNNLGQIVVWELPEKPGGDAPKPILRLDGHTNVISRLMATPDGKTLLSASYDHTVRYWDPFAKPEGEAKLVLNASAIEDAERRKSNGAKVPPPMPATVGLVKPTRTLDAHKEWVVNLDLTRDGTQFITGDDAGRVIVWDRASASILKEWKVKGWAYALALSPDKSQACVGERYPVVFDSARHAGLNLWNATTGEKIKDIAEPFKKSFLASAAYSPDGKLLAVGRGGEIDGTNGKVALIDPANGKLLADMTPGHLNGLTDIAWHPDGKHLATTGRDTVIRIWDSVEKKQIAEVGKGRGGQFKDWLHAVSWSADGKWLAAADMAGAVQIWTFA